MHRAILLVATLSLVAGCSSSTGSDSAASTTDVLSTAFAPGASGAVPDPTRPFDVFVPSSYTKGTPMPLVVLLHAYSATGDIQDAYLGLQVLAESKGFLTVHPDGTKNAHGLQFWNATDGCCGYLSTVDDVAYLTAVIDSVSAQYDVDPTRIYFMGHSNGGFMSYRMACELSRRVAAIASLAGATFDDPAKCNPSEPVSVLEVHGTADETVAYAGGVLEDIGGTYPGAAQTVATWATYDGCTGQRADVGAVLDLDSTIAGFESQLSAYSGCPAGIDVQLLTLQDGRHNPGVLFADGSHPLTEAMVDFLLAHHKP